MAGRGQVRVRCSGAGHRRRCRRRRPRRGSSPRRSGCRAGHRARQRPSTAAPRRCILGDPRRTPPTTRRVSVLAHLDPRWASAAVLVGDRHLNSWALRRTDDRSDRTGLPVRYENPPQRHRHRDHDQHADHEPSASATRHCRPLCDRTPAQPVRRRRGDAKTRHSTVSAQVSLPNNGNPSTPKSRSAHTYFSHAGPPR